MQIPMGPAPRTLVHQVTALTNQVSMKDSSTVLTFSRIWTPYHILLTR